MLRTQLAAHVLICGSGTMGLMMLQLAKLTGAASVDVVDINDQRLDTARELGCSQTAGAADKLDRAQGWDVVIDATGNERAIQDCLGRSLSEGVVIVCTGPSWTLEASAEPTAQMKHAIDCGQLPLSSTESTT